MDRSQKFYFNQLTFFLSVRNKQENIRFYAKTRKRTCVIIYFTFIKNQMTFR